MNLYNKISDNKGFTLIELMIAMALFVTMMVVVTGLFGQAVDNQRTTTSQKNLHESLSYSLNFLKTEVAGAKQSLKNSGAETYCGGASSGDLFFYTPSRNFLGSTVKDLYFINKNEQCVRYFLQVDNNGVTRLAVTRNGLPIFPYSIYLNASDSTMLDFDVDVIALDGATNKYKSAKLTMFLAAEPVDGSSNEILRLQTTVALTPFVCGQTIYDRDSFSYKTVQIGNQCWMAENLKTKTKPNGACINSGASFIAPQCKKIVSGVTCGGTSSPGNTFECGGENGSGRDCIGAGNVRGTEADCLAGYALYNWAATHNLDSTCNENGSNCGSSVIPPHQGICPKEWHVPTTVEFDQLVEYLDGQYGDGLAGAPLKTVGNCGGVTNCGVSGFNEILAGARQTNEMAFESFGEYGNYWLEEFNPAQGMFLWISPDGDNLVRQFHEPKKWNFSIRCLKD